MFVYGWIVLFWIYYLGCKVLIFGGCVVDFKSVLGMDEVSGEVMVGSFLIVMKFFLDDLNIFNCFFFGLCEGEEDLDIVVNID